MTKIYSSSRDDCVRSKIVPQCTVCISHVCRCSVTQNHTGLRTAARSAEPSCPSAAAGFSCLSLQVSLWERDPSWPAWATFQSHVVFYQPPFLTWSTVSCVCAVCGSARPSSPFSAAASPAPDAALSSPGPTRCPPAASPARPAPKS